MSVTLLFILDMAGTFFFAVSGAMVAIKKNMDLFGIIVLGTVTAIGGGTLREILIGQFPPFVLRQDLYFYIAITGSLFTFLFVEQLLRIRSIVLLADAVGLGTFVTIGVTRALEVDITATSAVVLGVISAVAGGMIRDVLAGEIPFVLTRDFYAVSCIIGGITYLSLVRIDVPLHLTMAFTTFLVIVLRVMAIYFRWKLPRPH
ncbi:MAG: trimeric intracellular cation channel family protein [Bacillota bacterium]|nr:trimeric intracellular cation channel family protein [Bacillota bacterium]MDW7682957.1 trimeric intracellular cation channel family protein [Bacillota bacterium]